MAERPMPVSEHDRVALVELVNRVVDRGVVLSGDITISVADVDLLYLGLRVLLCSPDRMDVRSEDESRVLELGSVRESGAP